MSSTFDDTHGNRFLIEGVLDGERDSYASLFPTAVTYRARHISTSGSDDAAAAAPVAATATAATHPQRKALGDTVAVTYVPLSSSLQGITPSTEATALLVLQDHVRLRRQLEHPLLRSLFDVFYTRQCLTAPVANEPAAAVVRRAVEANSSVAAGQARRPSRHTTVENETSSTRGPADGGDADVAPSSSSSSDTSATSTDAWTALVIVEEFIEGCTLADYADAVARRRLVPNSTKLQRDAAAIAYQLALLLHYLHGTGHVLCRELPFDSIALDQNKGFLSVRLPLSAVRMLPEPGERCLPQFAAALVSETAQRKCAGEHWWAEQSRPLRAPELRHIAYWDTTWQACTSDPNAFGAADMWTLGVVMTLLCTLNHKRFAQTTRAERLGVVCTQIERLPELLQSDLQEDLQHLIRSCLEAVPVRRPTAAAVLKSSAFVTNRSHTELEQHRAVISIAEAVANANKRKMPPAALQLAENNATAATRTVAASADSGLVQLSLQDTAWRVAPVYRKAFCVAGDGTLPAEPTTPRSAHILGSVAPSLSRATQDAFQDLERLCAQYTRLYLEDTAAAASSPAQDALENRLHERLLHSRQMPRDLPAVTRIFEELTERFAQLERASPEAPFRLIELLLEGFSNCPEDVAAVRESVTLADALLNTTWPPPPSAPEDTAEKMGGFDESVLSDSAEVDQREFQVADVLRAMPSMPERMLASDRAANTSAVLYNQWLKRQKKAFLKSDGY